FKIPFIYAATLGLVLNFAGVKQPVFISALNDIIKVYALPAMLILVGYQINLANFLAVRLAISGAAFRMVGGFIAGVLLANLLGLKDTSLGVVAISSSMPPAVNTYILAEKYSTDPEFAATAIFIGTLASFFIIPMVWEIIHH
ncbi:MAG: AEC family transporter, partial [Elusimicrobiota bacterium]